MNTLEPQAAKFIAETLRNTRLMLYAWKGARQNMGLADNHTELNEVIADIDAALKVLHQAA